MKRQPARSTVHARKVAAAFMSPGDAIPEKPERKKARDIEGPIHRSILAWLRVALHKDCVIWHTPNGGARDARVGKQMKDMGALAGIPDIAFIIPRPMIATNRMFFIEVKPPGRPLSTDQIETIGRLEKAGAYVAVAHSVDEARDALRKWNIATREAGT